MACYGTVWNGFMNVPCGWCNGCLQDRRTEWTFRLLEEQKDSLMSHFVTLTYNDDFLKYGQEATLYKKDVQDYIKRVRKENKYKMKYYFIGEYGDKFDRPHYHGIIFNAEEKILRQKWSGTHEGEKKDMGIVHIGKVNQKSIHYVTKYMVNSKNVKEGVEKPFSIMSNGIGLGYVKKHKNFHIEKELLHLTFKGGRKRKMIRYYKNKIWKGDEAKRFIEVATKRVDDYYRDLARQESENKEFWKEFNTRRMNLTRRMFKEHKIKKEDISVKLAEKLTINEWNKLINNKKNECIQN